MKLSKKVYLSDSAQKYMKSADMTDPENSKWFSYHDNDMSGHGFMLIGHAEIELDLFNPAQINHSAVMALKAQVQEVRAKAENEVTKLNEKIQQLLAIEN